MAESTLTAAESLLNGPIASSRAAGVALPLAARPKVALACLAERPRTDDERSEVKEVAAALRTVAQRRFGSISGTSAANRVEPERWLASVREVTATLKSSGRFFLGGFKMLAEPVGGLLADEVTVLRTVEERATSVMADRLESAVRTSAEQLLPDGFPSYVPGVDPPRTTDDVGDYRAGPGTPRLTLGYVSCAGLEVEVDTPEGTTTRVVGVTGRRPAPVICDFDRDGGFVTDSQSCIESAVSRLLALLPAGFCQVRVVDPLGLGTNADFLHRLGSSSEAIIGNRIETTLEGVRVLLDELEHHITYVNRKYLQGQFGSLTEFNAAAGQVAEPYRVVLLYDMPSLLQTSGDLGDLAARMRKISHAGRRCGVFLVARLPRNADPAGLGLDAILRMAPNPETAWVTERFGLETADRLHAAPITDIRLRWAFTHPAPLTPELCDALNARIVRGLHEVDNVVVTQDEVHQAAAALAARSGRWGIDSVAVATVDQEETWWQRSSGRLLSSMFGRAGAQDVAELNFASDTRSSALVAGVPGSGKSNWIHAVLMDLVLNYSTEELELYLVDFKEGVEFNEYAKQGLPHARVVAIESDRDFGTSVLANVDAEIRRRGEIFKSSGGSDVDLEGYRATTGERLPRVLLVMDEFQKLFERDDLLAGQAAEYLDRIIRQGRAFGVHALLASQTLSGHDGLKRHTLNQITTRVAFRCSAEESRQILAENNPDAATLSRPGEGLLNYSGGDKDANVRFQTTYWTPMRRSEVLQKVLTVAETRGPVRAPWVFNGAAPVPAHNMAELPRDSDAHRRLDLPIGVPFILRQSALLSLRRNGSSGHALIVADHSWNEVSIAAAAAMVDGAEVILFQPPTDELLLEDTFEQLVDAGAALAVGNAVLPEIQRLAQVVSGRHGQHDYRARAVVLSIPMLQRMRMMDFAAYENDAREAFEQILRDGPEVGVHVLAGVDGVLSLERRLSDAQLREFGIRAVGPLSREDAMRVVDNDAPTRLKQHQLFLMSPSQSRGEALQRFETVQPKSVPSLLSRQGLAKR